MMVAGYEWPQLRFHKPPPVIPNKWQQEETREEGGRGGGKGRAAAPLNVLFLSHKSKTYDAFLGRYYTHQYLACKDHDYIRPVMWGEDFEGYDNGQSLRDNLVRRFGSVAFFDVIFLFGIIDNAQLLAISDQTVVLIREHECWSRRCDPFIVLNNASIVMFTFAQDIAPYAPLSARRLFVHSPTSARHQLFFPGDVRFEPPNSRYGVLSFGAKDPVVYPLRYRLGELGEKGLIPDYTERKHPGYIHSLPGPEPDSPHLFEHPLERQIAEYAKTLHRTKICMMDSSVYRYAYQKFIEAAMAGCLIVSDIPYERSDQYRRFVVEIKPTDSDQHIIDTISWWLDHDAERVARAAIGQRYALEHFTWDHWANSLVAAYNQFTDRQFGMVFPYPHFVGCAPSQLLQGQMNPWCE